jgi:cytochrome oxidase Cu insertion factor (SCO1/SenC/PrrC family)
MASGALDDPVPMVSVPPLSLVDQHGKAFNLRDASSGRVLVTFAFAHCETVCPTLVQGVVRARAGAGRTDIPLVVVTVDPWRDVPSRLASIASGWGLAAGDKVLGGTVSDVNAALDAWGVWRSRDSSTGEVAHSATVVLVARGGDSAVIVSGNPESLQATLRQAESGRSAREAGRR